MAFEVIPIDWKKYYKDYNIRTLKSKLENYKWDLEKLPAVINVIEDLIKEKEDVKP